MELRTKLGVVNIPAVNPFIASLMVDIGGGQRPLVLCVCVVRPPPPHGSTEASALGLDVSKSTGTRQSGLAIQSFPYKDANIPRECISLPSFASKVLTLMNTSKGALFTPKGAVLPSGQ